MEWDDEKCLNLIEIYRNKPLLCDPKDRNYYKKHLKDDAWAEIGVAMHTDLQRDLRGLSPTPPNKKKPLRYMQQLASICPP
jgi:hypothetical protein